MMTNSEIVYLTNDNWNDYFEYRTMYQMYYKNQHIGGVRIGRIGQTEDRPDIPDEFETFHIMQSKNSFIELRMVALS